MTIMCERKECANLINGVCNQKKRSYSKRWVLSQFCRIQRILQRGQCSCDGQKWASVNHG